MNSKKSRLLIELICLFFVSLGLTLVVTFSNKQEEVFVIIKSVVPVYDKESTVVVSDDELVFNDKEQEVKYNVVIENPSNYDIKVSDINLTTPTEDFLEYEIENIKKDDVVEANKTKEIVVSFKTVKNEGWGRNFADELTANIIFEKGVKKEEVKPIPAPEEPKEEVKEEVKNESMVEEQQKEDVNEDVVAPVKDSEEIKQIFTLIENYELDNEELVFVSIKNVLDKQMIDVWIYSKPIYLGRFEVEVKDGKTKIVGLSDALKKYDIEMGNHHLVLQAETGDKIGYIEVKVNENKFEKVSEEVVLEDDVSNKILDNKEQIENKKEEKGTKNNGVLVTVLIITTAGIGVVIIVVVVKNKKVKVAIVILAVVGATAINYVDAEELIELPITFNVSFKSQNVMKTAKNESGVLVDYWEDDIAIRIKNFYISNEITNIEGADYTYDVSETQNGRVMAYLVKNQEDLRSLDLYLQADGVIYPNSNASYYFYGMFSLDSIENIEGLDVSNVTDMSYMFYETGRDGRSFTLDLGNNFDTSNVTNMSNMFCGTGRLNDVFVLDLGDKFDTSNVTDMNGMFYRAGSESEGFTLNLGDKFDTSKVTDMSGMFNYTGSESEVFTLDLGNKFDTSKVTNMRYMFNYVGYNSEIFTLDLGDKFDTSKVTNMSYMFYRAGYNSTMLNVTFTLRNVITSSSYYSRLFSGVATNEGTQMIVNYTSANSSYIDKYIATKTSGANVVKGVCIDCEE